MRKGRNRCCDLPWKPWTLIAGWRSRCKSAFPATVMIAGMVSASTSLQCRLSLLFSLPSHSTQSREKRVNLALPRLRVLDFSPFFFYLPPELGEAPKIIVVEKIAINGRVIHKTRSLFTRSCKKNADLRVCISSHSSWITNGISSRGYFINY